MQPVLRTECLGDGVNVFWMKAGEETSSHFSFTRLIELKVNALDILTTPGNYGVDEKTGMVGFIAFCQPSRHEK